MKIHLAIIVALSLLLWSIPNCSSKTQDTAKQIEKIKSVEITPTSTTKSVPATKKILPQEIKLPEFEAKIFKLINIERSKQNLKPYKVNLKLIQAAQAKAKDMNRLQYWSHTSPEGKMVNDFIRTTGYKYELVGENLARGFATPEDTMVGWMNSQTHKDNILHTEFEEVGIANYNDVKYHNITVLVLAQKF